MSLNDFYPVETLLDGTCRVRWPMQPILPGDLPYEIVIDVTPDGRISVNNHSFKDPAAGNRQK